MGRHSSGMPAVPTRGRTGRCRTSPAARSAGQGPSAGRRRSGRGVERRRSSPAARSAGQGPGAGHRRSGRGVERRRTSPGGFGAWGRGAEGGTSLERGGVSAPRHPSSPLRPGASRRAGNSTRHRPGRASRLEEGRPSSARARTREGLALAGALRGLGDLRHRSGATGGYVERSGRGRSRTRLAFGGTPAVVTPHVSVSAESAAQRRLGISVRCGVRRAPRAGRGVDASVAPGLARRGTGSAARRAAVCAPGGSGRRSEAAVGPSRGCTRGRPGRQCPARCGDLVRGDGPVSRILAGRHERAPESLLGRSSERPLAPEDGRDVFDAAAFASSCAERPGHPSNCVLDGRRHRAAPAPVDPERARRHDAAFAGPEADALLSEDVSAGVEARAEPAHRCIAPPTGIDPGDVDLAAKVWIGECASLGAGPLPVGPRVRPGVTIAVSAALAATVVSAVVPAVVPDRAPADPRRGVAPVDPRGRVGGARAPVPAEAHVPVPGSVVVGEPAPGLVRHPGQAGG